MDSSNVHVEFYHCACIMQARVHSAYCGHSFAISVQSTSSSSSASSVFNLSTKCGQDKSVPVMDLVWYMCNTVCMGHL